MNSSYNKCHKLCGTYLNKGIEMEIIMQIEKNKKQAIIGLMVMSGLAVLVFWLFINFEKYIPQELFKFRITIIVVLLALFIFAFSLLLKQIFSNKPSLILDDNGLTDNTGVLSVGFIPWENINGIKEAENSFKIKLLIILLKNPEEYISLPGKSMESSRRIQFKQFGSPVVISMKCIKIDIEKLKNIILEKINH